MKRKRLFGIIGGLLGFIMGLIGGGFLGLVIGGTFLGGLNLYENIGLNGYELAAYVGAVFGAVLGPPVGVGIALSIYKKMQGN